MHGRRRGLDPDDGGDGPSQRPESKRQKVPALASVIVEALKVDSLQKLCSSLEPILRRVVSEEVERALSKLGPATIAGRSSPIRIEGPDGRNLLLRFKTRLSQPIFTGGKVDGEQGAAIHVVLFDANTGTVLISGPESCAKLDVVVLEGDFNDDDDENWTEEEFESHVVREREGKRPLLTGDLQVTLKEGIGTLGDLTFTDNSSWIRSRKFRLGLKVSSGFCEGIRIREAKTEAFTVKDHRGELYKKHYPPSWNDEVWRLEKIGKDGSFHKKLTHHGIQTVEDFLRLYVRDPQRLRHILGSGMSNKMWDTLIDHAKTCPLSGTYYVYYSDDTRSCGAIFNNRYEFSGLISGNQFVSVESLTESQKVFADSLVKRAYDNWGNVIEYDGKALLNFKQSKKTMSTRADSQPALSNYPSLYDDQASQQHLPASVTVEQPVIETDIAGGGSAGYSGNQVIRYSNHPQLVSSDVNIEYGSTSSYVPTQQFEEESNLNQLPRNTNTGLALALPQESSLGFQPLGQSMDSTNLPYYNWPRQQDNQGDEYLTEEEIRMRSHEILENEEMQHLLRHLGMTGTSNGLPDDGFGFQSYMSPIPNFNFDEEQGRSSGKAVVGWLKIKAAMRWGIFIRKKAAEKRKAQLVELED